MLFGGRPIPKQSGPGRLLMILVLLSFLIPMGKFAVQQLPAFGMGRAKMSAERTALHLPRRLPWYPQNDPRRSVECKDYRITSDWTPDREDAWDYICTFVPQPRVSQQRLKVGVRVNHQTITHVSDQYELDVRYVK
jgi:hypothetical protein